MPSTVLMSLRSSNESPSYLTRQGRPGLNAAIAQARAESRDPDAGVSLLPRVIELSGASFADALHAIEKNARPRTDAEQQLDSLPLRDFVMHNMMHPTQRRPSSAAPPGYHRIETPAEVRQQIAEVERLKRLRDAVGW